MLGRVYEYFLGQFAGSEGKRGGEFYTPRSVVRVMVEMLEPYKGRVYDPCCGSGGMFVQSEKFAGEHGGRIGDIAVYGQEINYTTWRLCKMNLAVRGIDADIKWNNEGSFHKDELRDLKADFVLANPPFNISDWGGDRLREDVRWKYGAPPAGNANFAWLQHIVHHLAPNGTAGVVLANGSMSSTQSGEDAIRRALIEGVNGAPASSIAWSRCRASFSIRRRFRSACGSSPATNERLARNASCATGAARSCSSTRASSATWWTARARNSPTPTSTKITRAYHAWRGEGEAGAYEDVPGFCKSATLEEIKGHGYVLTPGRYVGAADVEDDETPFAERFAALKTKLEEQFAASEALTGTIRARLAGVGL